jgi:hypothetical protein
MKIAILCVIILIAFVCSAQAMYQIQVAGGPAYDVFLGKTSDYYSEYIGLNVGGALLLNRWIEPHVRFGGGLLYPGTELLRQYRLFYYPNFRKLVMYRYPVSLGVSFYPWLDRGVNPFFGAEIGAEDVSNFLKNASSDREQDVGWGPDFGILSGVSIPLDDVEEFFLKIGMRARYSNTARYVIAGESNLTQNAADSGYFTTSPEHIFANTWTLGLWVELVWGNGVD